MSARSRWSAAARDAALRARLDSLLSREAVFLLNNLVLVALCFVIFWGTFFPLISEAVTGARPRSARRGSTATRCRSRWCSCCSRGSGRLIAWRRATAANLQRNFALPVGVGAAAGGAADRARRSGRPRARRCSVCRVRGRGRRPGVVARRRSAARDAGRVGAARARLAGAPQPAPVRRLYRPRGGRGAARRGRGVVGVPGRSTTCSCAPGQSDRVGGYDDHRT